MTRKFSVTNIKTGKTRRFSTFSKARRYARTLSGTAREFAERQVFQQSAQFRKRVSSKEQAELERILKKAGFKEKQVQKLTVAETLKAEPPKPQAPIFKPSKVDFVDPVSGLPVSVPKEIAREAGFVTPEEFDRAQKVLRAVRPKKKNPEIVTEGMVTVPTGRSQIPQFQETLVPEDVAKEKPLLPEIFRVDTPDKLRLPTKEEIKEARRFDLFKREEEKTKLTELEKSPELTRQERALVRIKKKQIELAEKEEKEPIIGPGLPEEVAAGITITPEKLKEFQAREPTFGLDTPLKKAGVVVGLAGLGVLEGGIGVTTTLRQFIKRPGETIGQFINFPEQIELAFQRVGEEPISGITSLITQGEIFGRSTRAIGEVFSMSTITEVPIKAKDFQRVITTRKTASGLETAEQFKLTTIEGKPKTRFKLQEPPKPRKFIEIEAKRKTVQPTTTIKALESESIVKGRLVNIEPGKKVKIEIKDITETKTPKEVIKLSQGFTGTTDIGTPIGGVTPPISPKTKPTVVLKYKKPTLQFSSAKIFKTDVTPTGGFGVLKAEIVEVGKFVTRKKAPARVKPATDFNIQEPPTTVIKLELKGPLGPGREVVVRPFTRLESGKLVPFLGEKPLSPAQLKLAKNFEVAVDNVEIIKPIKPTPTTKPQVLESPLTKKVPKVKAKVKTQEPTLFFEQRATPVPKTEFLTLPQFGFESVAQAEAFRFDTLLKPTEVTVVKPTVDQLPSILETPTSDTTQPPFTELKPISAVEPFTGVQPVVGVSQLPAQDVRLSQLLKSSQVSELEKPVKKPTVTRKPIALVSLLPKKVKKPIERKVQSYDALIREKGRELKANIKPLPKKSAMSLLRDVLDNSLSAAGRIVRRKGKVPISRRSKLQTGRDPGPKNFRRGKTKATKNKIVEKRKFRLNSPGEVQGITAAKLLSQRKKQLKRFKL